MQQGGVYVMMIIWTGIYFGVGAVFEYLDIHHFIANWFIFATHEVGTVSDFLADPNYNFTKAEIVEHLGRRNEWHDYMYTKVLSVSYFSDALNQKGEISILNVVYPIVRFIDMYAPRAWNVFCLIGCFIGLMTIFKARKDGGDNGISEFDY
jgi:hypothetical protein